MKPYKAASPSQTVHRIRTILNELGIFTTERHFRREGMYYSCRVYIDNDDIRRYNIGTNGKGMSAEYALASAYAELMERLENRMLIFDIKYATSWFRQNNKVALSAAIPELGHRYFPDETFAEIDAESFRKYCRQFLPNVAKYGMPSIQDGTKYKMYFSDFFNVNTHQVENLPYHLIRMAASSTGLCAGNEPEEAILQGLNEIFERYVLQQLYLQRLTPPTIPFSVFDGTEIALRIMQLQKEKGLKIIVKDCSLDQGFPVIGLLLIDPKTNRYTFRLGADLSPVVALQRCFTEIFQGIESLDSCLQPILLDDDWDVKLEHDRNVVNGTGRFPRQLFGSIFSWQFDGFQLNEQPTFAKDLQYVSQWLAKKGFTLYLRDNSFLGFPAYHLFVPGLSEIDGSLYDVTAAIDADNEDFFLVKPEYRLHTLTSKEKSALIKKYVGMSARDITLFPYNSNVYNGISRELLLALLSYSEDKDDETYSHMRAFLEEKSKTGNQQSPYYYCIRDMFYAKSIGYGEQEIITLLSVIYSETLVKEVLSDMADRQGVLVNFPFPTCFQCEKCKIRANCSYLTIVHLENKIQQVQTKVRIDQCDLGKLFESC